MTNVLRIKGFKPGDNISILNTYYKRYKDKDNHLRDLLTLVYKDLNTGMKYKEEIYDPDMTFYTAKPDCRVPYNRLFVPEDEVIEHVTPKMDLDKNVADVLGLKSWYYDCIKSGDRDRAKEIHMHPDVFGTDINIEDFYRFEFDEKYTNEPFAPTKSYFDIEVDGIDMVGDFPELGECPVNAVTLIMLETHSVYTLLLRNSKNPQIAEFEDFITNHGFNDLRKFIKNHVNKNGKDLYKKYELDKFQFNMSFYDEDKEIDLIKDLFNLINTFRPDFVTAWNMPFDIPYIIQRIKNLGYNPEDIMCDPDFEFKYAEYFVDEQHKNTPEERGDFAVISSYSVYIDQLIQFASRRKGQSKEVSYTLDHIGNIVAKIGKLDYKHITTDISKLPYKNYKVFVYYNIMDTIVQHCIEFVAQDLDYILGKAIKNNTRYSKVHRQTTYLANRGKKEFYHSDGMIMGNNANRSNEKPTKKFPGAFVADPTKNSDKNKLRIAGRPVNIVDNSQDSDYKTMVA